MNATMTIDQIERLCQAYAQRRDALHERLTVLETELTLLKKTHLKEIRRCTALAADTESQLRAALESAPELFERPKTHVFHGIKVGYRKGAGGLDWEDDDDLVRKIERMFPDDGEAETYLIVKKKPSAEALESLDAATLKRLGVQVVADGEQVVIKPVETAIEKLVKALLKDAREQGEQDED